MSSLVTSDSRVPCIDQESIGHDPFLQYVDAASADNKSLNPRSNSSEFKILIDPDGSVRGGTVPALVDQLTAHENAGMQYKLLLYRLPSQVN
jgi:hypothetical protein